MMIHDQDLPMFLWVEASSTAGYFNVGFLVVEGIQMQRELGAPTQREMEDLGLIRSVAESR